MPPHSIVFCMTDTGILRAGWYGFNTGSAVAGISDLVGDTLRLEQLEASSIVLVPSVPATLVIAKVVAAIPGGLRVNEEVETLGLDLAEHGKEATSPRQIKRHA